MHTSEPLPEWMPRPGRTHATDCEATVLGTAMLCPAQAADVLGDLEAGDFVDPVHRVILTALRNLIGEGTRPDGVLVAAAYARHAPGPLPLNTFAARVHDCLAAASVPAAAPAYRRALIEARWRRDALVCADRITQAAREWPLTELHEVLHRELAALGRTIARLSSEPTAETRPALREAA